GSCPFASRWRSTRSTTPKRGRCWNRGTWPRPCRRSPRPPSPPCGWAAVRRGGAARQAARLVQKDPQNCEAVAFLAALRHERGEAAAARRMVGPALAVDPEDAGPSRLRCAVLSAAAIGDASRAGALVRHIA